MRPRDDGWLLRFYGIIVGAGWLLSILTAAVLAAFGRDWSPQPMVHVLAAIVATGLYGTGYLRGNGKKNDNGARTGRE